MDLNSKSILVVDGHWNNNSFSTIYTVLVYRVTVRIVLAYAAFNVPDILSGDIQTHILPRSPLRSILLYVWT